MAKKLTKRKAFNFLRSYYDVLNELNDDKDKLSYLLAIMDKSFLDENPEGLSFLANLCYESQRHSIESSVNGWKRAENTDLLGNPLTPLPSTQLTTPPTTPPTTPKEEEEEEKEENNKSVFDSVFDSFLLMRKQLKKPMTDKAIELLKSKLEKLAPADAQTQIEILEQSIMNNWQGVFPLKDSAKKEGANGTLLKDCDFDILPFKDIHRVKYRTVVAFYNFFIKRAEKLNRKDDLDLLNSADLGVWMFDIDQIEKEHQFKPFDFYTIAIYLKEILYDDQLHFDSDSITSLKDLYGNYSNGKSRYLRVSRDAAKYIDKFDKFQFVNILIDKINGN